MANVYDLLNQSDSTISNNSFLKSYNYEYYSYPAGGWTTVIKFSDSEFFMSFYLDLGECYNVQPTYRIGFNLYPITNTIIIIEWSAQKQFGVKD